MKIYLRKIKKSLRKDVFVKQKLCLSLPLLIFLFLNQSIFVSFPAEALTQFNSSADVVIGQTNFVSRLANRGGSPAANTLRTPSFAYSVNGKLFISNDGNNRVLIYNSIPTSNNASADVVIGQVDMVHNSANQGGSVAANTLKNPYGIWSDGNKLIIADNFNHRILIFNTLPTTNNASADVVIGQTDFVHNSFNPLGPNTLWGVNNVYAVTQSDGKKVLLVSDNANQRALVFIAGPKNETMQSNVSATDSHAITLTLSATEAKDMIISESPSFAGSSWEPYAATKDWTLSPDEKPSMLNSVTMLILKE
jgi:hypothetical protein